MISYQVVRVTPFAQNCRIFINQEKKQAVVSDPGARADDIYTALHDSNIELKAIIITHMHLDHVGGVARLQPAERNPDDRRQISSFRACREERRQRFPANNCRKRAATDHGGRC